MAFAVSYVCLPPYCKLRPLGATDFAQPRLQGLGFACCRAPCPPGPLARLGRACASTWRPLGERRGGPPAHGRVAARAYACAVNHRFQGCRPGAIADARRLSPAPAGMGQNAAYAVCPKLGRRMGGIRRPLTTTAPANPLRRKHEWESPYRGPSACVKRSGREPLAYPYARSHHQAYPWPWPWRHLQPRATIKRIPRPDLIPTLQPYRNLRHSLNSPAIPSRSPKSGDQVPSPRPLI